jgi:hypothetical protein
MLKSFEAKRRNPQIDGHTSTIMDDAETIALRSKDSIGLCLKRMDSTSDCCRSSNRELRLTADG